MDSETIEFTDILLNSIQKSTQHKMIDNKLNLKPYTEWAQALCTYLGGEVAVALAFRQPQIMLDTNSEQYTLTDPGCLGAYGFHPSAGETLYEHYLSHDPRTQYSKWPTSGVDKCYTDIVVQNEFSDWLASSDLDNLGVVLSFSYASSNTQRNTYPPPGIAIYPKRGNTQSATIMQRARRLKPILEHAFNINQKMLLLQSELHNFHELLPEPTAFFNSEGKHIRHNFLFEEFLSTARCLGIKEGKFVHLGKCHHASSELEHIIKQIIAEGINYQGKKCVYFHSVNSDFLIKVKPIFHPLHPLSTHATTHATTHAVGTLTVRTLPRRANICPKKIKHTLSEIYPQTTITKAESENIALLMLGLTAKQIAQERNLKKNSVDRVMSTIYEKLNVSGRHELIELVHWLMSPY
ncbi:MAG: LuxR C-terminal-related transcriptional regulator [Gammaproteobacteria bacterium]